MIQIRKLKKLIGRKVERLYFVVWPPVGEDNMSDVDITPGLIIEGYDNVFHIHIDDNDCWTPLIDETSFDNCFEWDQFQHRITNWMQDKINLPLQSEAFDATQEPLFGRIVSQKIQDIVCITLQSEFNPFAVKLCFPDDYILITPTSDGTTIETSAFNQFNNLDVFRKLDELEFVSLRECEDTI